MVKITSKKRIPSPPGAPPHTPTTPSPCCLPPSLCTEQPKYLFSFDILCHTSTVLWHIFSAFFELMSWKVHKLDLLLSWNRSKTGLVSNHEFYINCTVLCHLWKKMKFTMRYVLGHFRFLAQNLEVKIFAKIFV